jgi:hypothetical protein
MIIINNNKIDRNKLLELFEKNNINYLNKKIYIFIYDYIDILGLLFIYDINNFLCNISNNEDNIIIIYQDVKKDNEFECIYEKLYTELLDLIKKKYSMIKFVLYT